MGGIGLNCVPEMHDALAARGIQGVVAVGGELMPSARPMLRRRINDIFDLPDGQGAGGVVQFPAFGRFGWSPAMYRATASASVRPDVITLHSLYSFPVLAGYAMARRRQVPYALWPHGVLAPSVREAGKGKKAVYGSLIARRILDHAAVLVYAAEGEREAAAPLGLKTPSVVIPLGINLAPFTK